MIKSIQHKGLRKFFEIGDISGIQAKHRNLLVDRLTVLDAAETIEDIRQYPSYRLHPLKGKLKGRWSIKVSGNWRLTFEYRDGDVYVLDYEDYH